MLIDVRSSPLTVSEALDLLDSISAWLIIQEKWLKGHPVQNQIKELYNDILFSGQEEEMYRCRIGPLTNCANKVTKELKDRGLGFESVAAQYDPISETIFVRVYGFEGTREEWRDLQSTGGKEYEIVSEVE